MKIVIAPDKFKGSLSASNVARAISKGILGVAPGAQCVPRPLADGGDGTVDVLKHNLGGELIKVTVSDPLGRKVSASYLLHNGTAYIEMASASGLALLHPNERNAMLTSSFGTGELIRHALDSGVREVFIGVGGSATNDGWIGVAGALGYSFIDSHGNLLDLHGGALADIAEVDNSNIDPRIATTTFHILSDVRNPLYGPHGAAHVYGPQKGASPDDIRQLDLGLRNLARVIKRFMHVDVAELPGAGAAGGAGAGAVAFLNANIMGGIETIMDLIDFRSSLQHADLVITGEGRLDSQSMEGKVISGVLTLAQEYDIPVGIICGEALLTKEDLSQWSVTDIRAVSELATSPDDAMRNASHYLPQLAEQLVRSIST